MYSGFDVISTLTHLSTNMKKPIWMKYKVGIDYSYVYYNQVMMSS